MPCFSQIINRMDSYHVTLYGVSRICLKTVFRFFSCSFTVDLLIAAPFASEDAIAKGEGGRLMIDRRNFLSRTSQLQIFSFFAVDPRPSTTRRRMPKAAKERPKHLASLSAQILTDKSPYATESKRSKRKRKAEDNDEPEEQQVVSGKLSQQILTMAREQLNEDEAEEMSEREDEMTWRGPPT